MTVATSTSKSGPYAGAGTTGPFTVGFRFLENDHITVIQTNADDVSTELVLDTDYTVAGAGAASGSVTLAVALPVGQTLTIIRDVPFTQEADYVANDAFPAESHERALDLLTMQTQQIKEVVDRTLQLPPTVVGVSTTLPAPESSQLIGWNEAANALQNFNASLLATVVAFGTANADKFDGDGVTTQFTLSDNPGALNNLDVSINGVTQSPGDDYTWADGTILTFTSPPPAGTQNVLVRYMQGLPSGVSRADGVEFTPAGTISSTTVQAAIEEVSADVTALSASGGAALVGFLQSGTGAVDRTMLAKAREQISVLDFGAVADGVTDDAAAIQLALDYVSLTGKTVYFPAGSYAIGTSLEVTGNNVRVLLDHNASILHNTSDFMALRISGNNCVVEGGLGGGFIGPAAWDPGTGAATPAYAVIWVTGQNFTALNTRVFNIRRIGIGVKDVNNATVQGCVIDGNQPSPVFPLTTTLHFGVFFDPGTEASFGNFRAQNCRIKACTTGVFVGNYGVGQTAQAVVISDCLFDGMWDHGVYSNYTNGMTLTGCAFNRCHVGVAASGRGNVITNNTHYTEKTAGLDPRDVAAAVSLRDPEQCIVSNISIRGNGDTVSGETVIGVDLVNVTATAMNNNIVENISMLVATGKAQAVRIVATTTHSGNIIRNVSYYGAVRDSLAVIEVGGSAGIQCQISGITARILGGVGVRVVSAVSLTQAQISDISLWVEYSAPGAEIWFMVLLDSCAGVVVRDLVASAGSGLGANITLRGLTESTAASLNELHNVKLVQIASLVAFVPAVAFSGTSLMINIADGPAPTAGYRAGSIYRRTATGGGGIYTVVTDGGAWTLLT